MKKITRHSLLTGLKPLIGNSKAEDLVNQSYRDSEDDCKHKNCMKECSYYGENGYDEQGHLKKINFFCIKYIISFLREEKVSDERIKAFLQLFAEQKKK